MQALTGTSRIGGGLSCLWMISSEPRLRLWTSSARQTTLTSCEFRCCCHRHLGACTTTAHSDFLSIFLRRFTSDHGYSLGELNLNWDKRNVYEFDVKIHLLIRGPGIAPGSTFNQVLSNVDLAPSMLSLAGLGTVGMDGRSFIPLAIDPDDTTCGISFPTHPICSCDSSFFVSPFYFFDVFCMC